jgi:hypothetical protein
MKDARILWTTGCSWCYGSVWITRRSTFITRRLWTVFILHLRLYPRGKEARLQNLGGWASFARPSSERIAVLLPDFISIMPLLACEQKSQWLCSAPSTAISAFLFRVITFRVHKLVSWKQHITYYVKSHIPNPESNKIKFQDLLQTAHCTGRYHPQPTRVM